MLVLFNFLNRNRWYIHMVKNTLYTKNTMPPCTQMPSSLGFLYFHPYLFFKKIANIYKVLFLFILEWHHIDTICFLSPDTAVATYHRQPFHFSGCWASLPWLCHYLVEQYHSWAFELILDIVHVMSHFTCISMVSIQKWETTHTLIFERHWQSLPSRGWFCSHATYSLTVLLTHNIPVRDGIQMLHLDTVVCLTI